jgi:phosphoglycerate dehydrogenase-like enzyme
MSPNLGVSRSSLNLKRTLFMSTAAPVVYVALAPTLVEELGLATHLERLGQRVELQRWPGPGSPSLQAIEQALGRAQVLITGWGTPSLPLADWSPEASPLRLVAHTAGTVKQLVPVVAIERGLLVTHANDSLADAVAEFTIGAMIMAYRGVFAASDRLRAGIAQFDANRSRELRGSTVGIIGASAIGRRVLALLAGFGTRCLLYDPYCSQEVAHSLGAELVDLDGLLRTSQIVSFHAPITPETIGMLGAREFALMQDHALFINTARGVLIDPAALLAELQTGRISALLDVTDPTEPLPRDSLFLALPNCTVLPHIAAATYEARQRQSQITIDEVLRFLDNQALQHRVAPERWATMA